MSDQGHKFEAVAVRDPNVLWCRKCGAVRQAQVRNPGGKPLNRGKPNPGCGWFVRWMFPGRRRTPWRVSETHGVHVDETEPVCPAQRGAAA